MARIALISCTSAKKAYKCPARELYSESPRFRLAYAFAKLVADKIFVLSAKYGLVSGNMMLEPYDETLNDKSVGEQQAWGEKVIKELGKVSDLEHDEFIILAGENYYKILLPNLNYFWIPLKGKKLGEWIPELERLIALEEEQDKAVAIHMLFNSLPRLDWTMIDQIPYSNGIYVMFEKGESYKGMDRIVRVGTHRGRGRLKTRLRDHFLKEDADGSILRKNIGRAFLNAARDPYLKVWEIDMHISENVRKYGHLVNKHFETELERKITGYLRENVTFITFPVEDEAERLRLEEGIIATLNRSSDFRPSNSWLGLSSPVTEIAQSGLWNRQGLDGKPLSDEELERVKWLIRFGNNRYRDNADYKKKLQRMADSVKQEEFVDLVHTSANEFAGSAERITTEDIRQYIEKLLQEAKRKGYDYIELVSGDIHKQLGLKDRMPQVCSAMYQKMMPGDKVLHTTPSGKSSTIKIRYYLENR
ncbi:DUF6884 domain-containing protein [Caldicoprobacter faecalis]|uniref:Uncharacterized protein n=1 Tax=Caldicoprobacter faecalis TaxID=937334 RepID=A0A1I5VCJ6_9FIRM|nr:DUF6884 domain-containing protein [Caldicoprobacter faecalis]SFQ05112.1 hypothetical protein SAMN05444406_11080 [Caldicoprobacter faecalis]